MLSSSSISHVYCCPRMAIYFLNSWARHEKGCLYSFSASWCVCSHLANEVLVVGECGSQWGYKRNLLSSLNLFLGKRNQYYISG
jgi:hypothetical protein